MLPDVREWQLPCGEAIVPNQLIRLDHGGVPSVPSGYKTRSRSRPLCIYPCIGGAIEGVPVRTGHRPLNRVAGLTCVTGRHSCYWQAEHAREQSVDG